MRPDRERSAGGVVGRDGKLLLVQVKNLEGEIVWTFPKGHLEKGETPLAAALREVEEETGWRCRNAGALTSAVYRFKRGDRPVFKRVFWYQMEPVEKTGKPDPDEIRRTKWVPERRTAAVLSYPSDSRVLASYLRKKVKLNH